MNSVPKYVYATAYDAPCPTQRLFARTVEAVSTTASHLYPTIHHKCKHLIGAPFHLLLDA